MVIDVGIRKEKVFSMSLMRVGRLGRLVGLSGGPWPNRL